MNSRCRGFAASATRALGVLVLLQLFCPAHCSRQQLQTWPSDQDQSIEAKVARLAISHGTELNGFQIGQECPTCLRGVIATRDIAEGETILSVPLSLAVRFRDENPSVPAQHAYDLLDRMHNDPSFNASWALFWESHPGPDEVFTPEIYTDEQLEMLQTPELEDLARYQRDQAEGVYAGGHEELPPFNQTVPDDKVGLQTFKYVASLLCSRMFGLPRDGNDEPLIAHLLPVADFFNHNDDPSAWRTSNDTWMTVHAIKPIKAGEAITFNYFSDVIHRPDMSLFFFGFVEPKEPPLMASVDLPTFDEDKAYAETPPDDSMYDDPSSKYVTQEEYERLQKRLAAAATTLEQDKALLGSGMVTDWRMRTILQYRVQRKRAMQVAMDKIAAHLGFQQDGAEHGGDNTEL